MLQNLDKTRILKQLVAQLEVVLTASQVSAEAARDAAVNEESKSEDKHDTRSIEAGYLAGAQRKRVSELKELINYFKVLKPRSFANIEAISATALCRLEVDGQDLCYFVLPQGGGLKTEIDGVEVQTITPLTPLGEALLGMKAGNTVMVESKKTTREYEILESA